MLIRVCRAMAVTMVHEALLHAQDLDTIFVICFGMHIIVASLQQGQDQQQKQQEQQQQQILLQLQQAWALRQ